MKRKSILPIIYFIITFLGCQNVAKSQTPAVVKSAFEIKYPGEKHSKWEIDSNGNYETHFKVNGIKYRADFSPNGQWIETETNIKKKDLPEPVKEAIKKNYGNEDIAEIEKVDSATKGLFYDVEFKQKGKNKDVEYNASGKEL